jgi:8-oxo-dGTP diphosphatase
MMAPVTSTPALVVGVAVVRHGRVLAARRTRPTGARGRWELPGGKAEPGEQPADAAVRELREELGCDVRVTGRLAGEQPVGPGMVLRVVVAELASGEPVPHEHDAVRWLGPEQLYDVDWLDPDRPFLAELEDLLLSGERLEGGNVGGAVRIGRTVRRPTGPWTPAVHRLLGQLHDRGLRAVPRVLGMDARGREVLSHLPGTVVDVEADLLSDAQLADLGAWARELHDLTAGLPVDGPWRLGDVDRHAVGDGPLVLAHNDLAPYNVCFAGQRLSGVFDWDLAGPSTPLMELAHLAWNGIPLYRPVPAAVCARRLHVLAAAYGGPGARDIVDAVPLRVRLMVDDIKAAVAQGDEQMRGLTALGEPGRTEGWLAGFLERVAAIEDELVEEGRR